MSQEMTSVERDILEILADNRKRADQIPALAAYVQAIIDEPVELETGTPGAICHSERVGELTLNYNGNGELVSVEN